MKHGFRKPSFRKSIAARTVGKAKRQLMKELIPGYGTREMGIIHPIRSAYNKLYHQTTFGINDINNTQSTTKSNNYNFHNNNGETKVIDSNAKKIHNEIDKINKKDDYDFFIYLNYLYKSVDSLRDFETKYSFNHARSDELETYLKKNQDYFINKYLYRYYNKVVNKLNILKTYNAKVSNVTNFTYTIDSNREFLNEENLRTAEQLNNELLKLLNENA